MPKVGVFAISFSGGLALLAAGDPQYAPSIGWIASIGGYYDLAHVLRFFATGEAVRPDGSVAHLQPHEYGPLIVIYDEPQDFFSAHDAPIADKSLKLLLHGDGKASEALMRTMSPAGQQIMQDLYHKQREAWLPRSWPRFRSAVKNWQLPLLPAICDSCKLPFCCCTDRTTPSSRQLRCFG